jgi:hypothetical protein
MKYTIKKTALESVPHNGCMFHIPHTLHYVLCAQVVLTLKPFFRPLITCVSETRDLKSNLQATSWLRSIRMSIGQTWAPSPLTPPDWQ